MGVATPESADEAEDRETFLARVLLPEPIVVPSGVDGLELVHFMSWTQEDARPSDGHWSVTLAGRNIAVQRCNFRTLHSAANYAERIKDLVDWTGPHDEWTKGDQGIEFSKKMRHAEAHAHEIDAVYPPGNWVPFSNGPAILDDDGTTRQFLSQAPSLDWTKDDEGTHRCAECGELPVCSAWIGWTDVGSEGDQRAMTERDIRKFVESALARTASGDRLARSMQGAAQTYAQGVNDGIKEALEHVLAFIDQGNRAGDDRD